MSENKPPRMTAKKIYLKDASFESPSSPGVFLQTSMNPDIDMNINIDTSKIDEEGTFYEVTLQVTVTANQEGNTLFLSEIVQAGVFEIHADDEEHLQILLQVGCANMLLPFAREELASLVSKGGFPQLLISPINFENVYRQKLMEAKAAAEQQPN